MVLYPVGISTTAFVVVGACKSFQSACSFFGLLTYSLDLLFHGEGEAFNV
jgi:hypothetical protein